MNLARQSVQRVADVLAELGLVEYLPDPADKRARLVRVTDTGRALLAELEVRQQAWLNTLVEGLREAEIAQAAQLVEHIAAQIDAGTRANAITDELRIAS
jgi:DNA-binding MarR family transcriptional regulator